MKEVPQVHRKTCISQDYINEFSFIDGMFNDGDRSAIAEHIMSEPIKTYEERFPLHEYCNVVNRENTHAVFALNIISRIANRRLVDPYGYSDKFFMRMMNVACKLIYGKRTLYKV